MADVASDDKKKREGAARAWRATMFRKRKWNASGVRTTDEDAVVGRPS